MKTPTLHIFFALVLLFGAGGVLLVTYFYIAGESARAAELSAALSAKTAESEHASTLAAARAELGGDEATINNYFISEANIVPFLSELQGVGSALGATVTVGSVGSDKARPNALSIALTITGSFDAVMRTLGGIEYAPYAITPLSFALSNVGQAWTGNLALSVAQVQGAAPATSAGAGAKTASSTPSTTASTTTATSTKP